MTDVQSDAKTARDVIAEAVEIVCSDGNSDTGRVADDILAAIAGAGYKILSREPTQRAVDMCHACVFVGNPYRDVWHIMWDAAPPQPAPGEEGR
jgi:hypothetical protein